LHDAVARDSSFVRVYSIALMNECEASEWNRSVQSREGNDKWCQNAGMGVRSMMMNSE